MATKILKSVLLLLMISAWLPVTNPHILPQAHDISVLPTGVFATDTQPVTLTVTEATVTPLQPVVPVIDRIVQDQSMDFWKDFPVIPEGVSERVREIYERGLRMGNDPHAFSKVGDCNSTNPYFLADYDLGPDVYNLGEYAYLQDTITYFSGSFSRHSLAAKVGLSTAGVLAPLWADWKYCSSNETPLDCELRNHRPSFAIISLGTNEAYDVKKDPSTFEGRLRRIIEHSIDQGVVPILSTKADNDEGNYFINSVTARLAVEYKLPLWNYWKAVQPLPRHGMRSSDHLTFAPTKSYTDFSSQDYLSYGMQVRNLTALQVLDVVRRSVSSSEINIPVTSSLEIPAGSPIYDAGATMVSDKDEMKLIYIPSENFMMGSSEGSSDQSPLHNVFISGYWLDSTEVTSEMFAAFLNSQGNQTEGGVSWLNPNEPFVWVFEKDGSWQAWPGMEKLPIVGVSWYGANAYCQWAGRQLPTEAQWEFAASSARGFRFPWGDEALDCDHTHFAGCGNSTVNVDGLPLGINSFGVYDLAGNVAEWVGDRYASDYYGQSPQANPTGPSNGYYRVVRGGSWKSSYLSLQTWDREWAGADKRDSSIGFRCALNP
jgi:formylglycine-generating enzyme required for sulfatase activity